MFHICEEGERQSSFLCPRGTIFNQVRFKPSFLTQKTRISLKKLQKNAHILIRDTITETDTNVDAHTDTETVADTDTNTETDIDMETDTDTDKITDTDADTDTDTDTNVNTDKIQV